MTPLTVAARFGERVFAAELFFAGLICAPLPKKIGVFSLIAFFFF